MGKSAYLSDEERARRGTLRASNNEAKTFQNYLDRKILPFPVLIDIPQPAMPLNDVGRQKYFELCKILKDAGRLVSLTRDVAEAAAALWQSMHQAMGEGKPVRAAAINQFRSLYENLGVNESNRTAVDARGSGAQENPFAANGFAARHKPPVRPA